MVFWELLCAILAYVGFMHMRDAATVRRGRILGGIVFVVAIIAIIAMIFSGGSDSSSSKRSWSDLSDVEKDNARWAYEVKQAIDSYNK